MLHMHTHTGIRTYSCMHTCCMHIQSCMHMCAPMHGHTQTCACSQSFFCEAKGTPTARESDRRGNFTFFHVMGHREAESDDIGGGQISPRREARAAPQTCQSLREARVLRDELACKHGRRLWQIKVPARGDSAEGGRGPFRQLNSGRQLFTEQHRGAARGDPLPARLDAQAASSQRGKGRVCVSPSCPGEGLGHLPPLSPLPLWGWSQSGTLWGPLSRPGTRLRLPVSLRQVRTCVQDT